MYGTNRGSTFGIRVPGNSSGGSCTGTRGTGRGLAGGRQGRGRFGTGVRRGLGTRRGLGLGLGATS